MIGVRRVLTHRSSDVNRDDEFLLALVFFSWRGIHDRSLGPREILPASGGKLAKVVYEMFQIGSFRTLGTLEPFGPSINCQPPDFAPLSYGFVPQDHQTPVQNAKVATQEPQRATEYPFLLFSLKAASVLPDLKQLNKSTTSEMLPPKPKIANVL